MCPRDFFLFICSLLFFLQTINCDRTTVKGLSIKSFSHTTLYLTNCKASLHFAHCLLQLSTEASMPPCVDPRPRPRRPTVCRAYVKIRLMNT